MKREWWDRYLCPWLWVIGILLFIFAAAYVQTIIDCANGLIGECR